MRRLYALGAASVLAAVLSACGSSSPSAEHATSTTEASTTSTHLATTTTSTTSSSRTRRVTYEAFTADGMIDRSLHVTATLKPRVCEGGGVAGNSSYRCFAGNGIYDRCFSRPGATTGPLVCTTNPASSDVVELTTSSLPGPLRGAPEEWPWAVQLSNGQVCVLVNAAWGGLGPLGRQPTSGGLADCHVPTQGTPWWTVACQDLETDASPFVSYQVATVWL